MTRPALILALLLLLPCLQGCFAPPVVIASAGLGALQTGTTAFIRGDLEHAAAYPLDIAFQATKDGLRDLQFPIVSERHGKTSADIVVRETEGRAIKVHLEMKSPTVTQFSIRVGVWGDQSMSQLVQQAIVERIPKDFKPPEPEPGPPEPAGPRSRHREPYFPE